MILVVGYLLLCGFEFYLNCMQIHWFVRFGDSTYGIQELKSMVFLEFGRGSVEVSRVIDYATLALPIIGLGLAGGVWISRKFGHAGV